MLPRIPIGGGLRRAASGQRLEQFGEVEVTFGGGLGRGIGRAAMCDLAAGHLN